ncbi:MAG: radical SAM protein [Gemmatimonadales bacterium]
MLGITKIEKTGTDTRLPIPQLSTVRSLAVSASSKLRKLWNGYRGRPSLAEHFTTVEFHLTSDCEHDCPYCWGPKDFSAPVDTATALRIVWRVSQLGAKRIVFTGGDPLTRPDTRLLILYARDLGLSVTLATAGERLSGDFLESVGSSLDTVSLPLDGSCEAINCRTKRRGHFAAILQTLERLREYPEIDVVIRTAVTRHNVEDVPRVARLVEEYAETTCARVRHEVYHAFPRAMFPASWRDLLVSDGQFAALHDRLRSNGTVPVQFLDHGSLDRVYLMIFPDGRLVIPQGPRYYTYGRFLEIADIEACLQRNRISAERDARQSEVWAEDPLRH